MTHVDQPSAYIDYRLHPPRSLRYVGIVGSAAIALGIFSRASMPVYQSRANFITAIGTIVLISVLALSGFIRIFQRARDHLRVMLDEQIPWRGDETVLDVGTGSGILLFACAKQLHSGSAIGIDIYDQNAGGGSADMFWRNAHAEGIADRVDLRNVDAREMPFLDGTFDVTVSSLAMHHVGTASERQRATAEIIRTLKPGGRIIICDLTAVLSACEQTLRQAGMINVQRRAYLGVFSLLSAEKPHAPHPERIQARSAPVSMFTAKEVF